MALGKEPCVICQMPTSNIPEGMTSETYICSVCEGKYGDKLFKKLIELGIKFNAEIGDSDKETKPFDAHVSYSGGTKEDVIRMVCSIIDQADITLDEIRENMW